MQISIVLKKLIQDRKIQQKKLATSIDVSTATVSLWLSGDREPNSQQRKKLAEFFGITEAELFGAVPSPDVEKIDRQVQKIPLVSWVHANQFAGISDPFPVGVSDTWILHTATGGKNMFALKVMSDCMEPEFREGDIIIVKPNVEARNGDFVIIKDGRANEATFKQLKIYGKKTILHPLNPKYQDIELDQKKNYEIVGVVVQKSKSYK